MLYSHGAMGLPACFIQNIESGMHTEHIDIKHVPVQIEEQPCVRLGWPQPHLL